MDYRPIPKGFDKFHVHEVADRLYLLIGTLDTFVTTHPLVVAFPELQDKINEATNILAGVYQEVGAIGFKYEGEKP